jgi:cullin 3
LEELNRKWAKHHKALQMIRDILMYMDKTFIPSTHKTPIHELGLNLWRDVVIHSSKPSLGSYESSIVQVASSIVYTVIGGKLLKNFFVFLLSPNKLFYFLATSCILSFSKPLYCYSINKLLFNNNKFIVCH